MPIDEGDNELAKFLASRGVLDTGYNYQYERPQGEYGTQDYLERTANLTAQPALKALWAEYLRRNPQVRRQVREAQATRGFGLGGIAKGEIAKALMQEQAQLIRGGQGAVQSEMSQALARYQQDEVERLRQTQEAIDESFVKEEKQMKKDKFIWGLFE